jgi:hypothetical protein
LLLVTHLGLIGIAPRALYFLTGKWYYSLGQAFAKGRASKLSFLKKSPKQLLAISRSHWGIENDLHKTRDICFDEDRCTIRKGSSPQVMAALRNTALYLATKIFGTVSNAIHRYCFDFMRSINLVAEN